MKKSWAAFSVLATQFFHLAVWSVSARVCILSTERAGGRVRFILPPGDPCSCTRIKLGGHNTHAPPRGEAAPIYIDYLPNSVAGLARLFGCMDRKSDKAERNSQGVTQSYADCQEIRDAGHTTSGVYSLNFNTTSERQAYCDMETPNSGFIVIQRRLNGSVDFNRSWAEYQDGFGDLEGEFWWGNRKLRNLTDTDVTTWELVVDLEAFDGDFSHVRYGNFSVTGDTYDLTVDDFESIETLSTAGDGLSNQQRAFTTLDKDNDMSGPNNCARLLKGGWWYDKCRLKRSAGSNLNGEYFNDPKSVGDYEGVVWASWKGNRYSLKGCQMKIRRR